MSVNNVTIEIYRITSNLTDTRKSLILVSVHYNKNTLKLVAVAPSGELEHTYTHAYNDTVDIVE